MPKRFSTDIVSDVLGRSFDLVDMHAEPESLSTSVQMTILVNISDYDVIWNEVDRRRMERRANGMRVHCGTSQVVEELVEDFLEADERVRDSYYEMVKTGDHRMGLRLSRELRERIDDECIRRIRGGTIRRKATVTSVILAAMKRFVDEARETVDEFSMGLVF